MTELEKIERAQIYITKLANGIDPLNDSPVPEGDIINQVQLSRCLFFVSDVLRQVIENGGISGKKAKKISFSLPMEKRTSFEFSQKPVSASEIARRINALCNNENMQSLSYKEITDWLSEIGLLASSVTSDGKQTKRPTPQGMAAGISIEEREGSRGPYQVVVYDLEAQHFILDNLDAVTQIENKNSALASKPWTAAHEECLADLYKKGVPVSEIAVTLKRSTNSIRARLKKLNLI